jgi:hypothetical protein
MAADERSPAAQDNANFEVNISNLSLPFSMLTLGSVGQHERYLRTLAVDGLDQKPGLELTPAHSVFMSRIRQIDAGATKLSLFDPSVYEAEALSGMVRSVHASFRDETVGDSLTGRLFPHTPASLEYMEAAQRVADQPLHAVVYARDQGKAKSYADKSRGFKEWSVQPKANDWTELWGMPEVAGEEEIRLTMEQYGITSFTWDVAHSQTFDEPLELCKRLSHLGLVSEVHLALNRQDMASKYGGDFATTTRQAKEAFVKSAEAAGRTLEGEMLAEVVRDWKIAGRSGAVVYEEKPGLFSRPADTQREQKAIVETAYALIADVKSV